MGHFTTQHELFNTLEIFIHSDTSPSLSEELCYYSLDAVDASCWILLNQQSDKNDRSMIT
jgi:hypothetical protein